MNSNSVNNENKLTLLGFAAFLDPPKETATQAIALLKNSGVTVKILTGDSEIITKKICNEVGLRTKSIILGSNIKKMNEFQLYETVEKYDIFAKLSPFDKQKIVEILQKNGHVVGFLGDGINDSPALKTADVGISVDTAVDIAKESADIILLEKSLLILEQGIKEGRRVFGNISKYLMASSSSNLGNMLSLVGASIFLPFLPLAPVQIIAKNLLYDISQVSLFSDNVDNDYIQKPQYWDIKYIKNTMITLGPINVFFDYITFVVLILGFNALSNKALFQTGWFIKTLIAEILVIHAIRTNKIPFIQSNASIWIFLTNILIVCFTIWLIDSHYAIHLGFVNMPGTYWAILTIILITYLVTAHILNKNITH